MDKVIFYIIAGILWQAFCATINPAERAGLKAIVTEYGWHALVIFVVLYLWLWPFAFAWVLVQWSIISYKKVQIWHRRRRRP